MSGTKQPNASAYLQTKESENDHLPGNRRAVPAYCRPAGAKQVLGYSKTVMQWGRLIDFHLLIYFFLAKTGKIQKCGRQVETIKYMHDFNVVVYLENRLIFCCPILLFSTRNQPSSKLHFLICFFPLKKRKEMKKRQRTAFYYGVLKKWEF